MISDKMSLCDKMFLIHHSHTDTFGDVTNTSKAKVCNIYIIYYIARYKWILTQYKKDTPTDRNKGDEEVPVH